MKSFIAVVCAVVFAAGCGESGSSPSAPSSASTSMTGTWVGTAADSTGTAMGANYTGNPGPGAGMMGGGMMQGAMGQMTWQVTQQGTAFSGTMSFAGMQGRGPRMTVTGTMNPDGTFTCQLNMPAGSMMMEGCTATASGQGQFHQGMMSGTYTGTHSCLGPFGNGQFALNRK